MSKVVDHVFSVVLIGEYNVFHHLPPSLESFGLLNSDDIKRVKVERVSPGDVALTLPWGALRVEAVSESTNRLMITLTDLSAKSLFRDFVVSLLNYNDTARPYALGLNPAVYVSHATREEWDNFGDTMTPKEQWLDLLGSSKSRAGMNGIQIKIESVFEPAFESSLSEPCLNLSLKPVNHTSKAEKVDFCTEITSNYHFNLGDDNCTERAITTFDKYFETIFSAAEENALAIVKRFS